MSLGPTNFKIVKGMLRGHLLDFLGYYAYDRANSKDAIADEQVPNTPALYDDHGQAHSPHDQYIEHKTKIKGTEDI